jgi:NADPH-dependent 2,4-dienoyl-CoA reductase/sulfur reductase-like enzyme
MQKQSFDYIVVGGGLAAASAVEGIRELDENGSLLLISEEKHLPYDRPPLSKKLWFGSMKEEEIFLHEREYYSSKGVTLALNTRAASLDPAGKTVTDQNGGEYEYENLLLATGGSPRRLSIPGGELDGICYFRSLDDYRRIRKESGDARSVAIIGGGFIGSELAAALSGNNLAVTMIYPEEYLCSRIFPPTLGRAVQDYFLNKGIRILNGDKPLSIEKSGQRFLVRTERGATVESEILIVGIGITPNTDLAQSAGLEIGNGIKVNAYAQTSNQHIYAAGDIAFFPYAALDTHTRIEHWDHALKHGKQAGRNMAGACEPYNHQPFFYSDLFELSYEATGEIDSRLETFADWQQENHTGVVYYLNNGVIRGVMMCNVWEKVDFARELIRKKEHHTRERLTGLIR